MLAVGASLYLVGKLGFSLTSKYTKRAGLDYWESVDLHKLDSMEQLYDEFPNGTFYYLTTKLINYIRILTSKMEILLCFGPETRGLPDKYVTDSHARTIPMKEGQRSLNLSNSVAIVAYEAIRQNGL